MNDPKESEELNAFSLSEGIITNYTSLFRAVENKDWESVAKCLESNPEDAELWTSKATKGDGIIWTRLALHEACKHHPPLHTIESLARAYPDAIHAKDLNGKLALHHAAAHGASVEVVKWLVDQDPSQLKVEDSFQKTPSMCVMTNSIPQSIAAADNQVDVIQALSPLQIPSVDTDPSVENKELEDDNSVVDAPSQIITSESDVKSNILEEDLTEESSFLLEHKSSDDASLLLSGDATSTSDFSVESDEEESEYADSDITTSDDEDIDDDDDVSLLDVRDEFVDLYNRSDIGVVFRTTRGLLQNVFKKENADDKKQTNQTELFSATLRQDWDTVLRRLWSNSEEAEVWAKAMDSDDNSRLPIHQACVSQAPPDVIEKFIQVYPQSAQEQDKDGQLPLHHAVITGASLGVVEILLKAYPKGVEIYDNYHKTPLMCLQSRSIQSEDNSSMRNAITEAIKMHYSLMLEKETWKASQQTQLQQLDKKIDKKLKRELVESKNLVLKLQRELQLATQDNKRFLEDQTEKQPEMKSDEDGDSTIEDNENNLLPNQHEIRPKPVIVTTDSNPQTRPQSVSSQKEKEMLEIFEHEKEKMMKEHSVRLMNLRTSMNIDFIASKSRVTQLQKDFDSVMTEKNETKTSYEKILEDVNRKLVSSQEELEKAVADNEVIRKELDSIRLEQKETEDQHSNRVIQLEEELKIVQQERNMAREETAQVKQDMEGSNTQIETLQQKLDKVTSAVVNIVGDCEDSVAMERKLNTLKTDFESFTLHIEELETEIESVQIEKSTLEHTNIEEQNNASEMKDKLTNANSRLESLLGELKSELALAKNISATTLISDPTQGNGEIEMGIALTQDQVFELRQRLEFSNQEVQDLQIKLDEATRPNDEGATRLQDDMAALRAELHSAKHELVASKHRCRDLQSQVDTTKTQSQATIDEMRKELETIKKNFKASDVSLSQNLDEEDPVVLTLNEGEEIVEGREDLDEAGEQRQEESHQKGEDMVTSLKQELKTSNDRIEELQKELEEALSKINATEEQKEQSNAQGEVWHEELHQARLRNIVLSKQITDATDNLRFMEMVISGQNEHIQKIQGQDKSGAVESDGMLAGIVEERQDDNVISDEKERNFLSRIELKSAPAGDLKKQRSISKLRAEVKERESMLAVQMNNQMKRETLSRVESTSSGISTISNIDLEKKITTKKRSDQAWERHMLRLQNARKPTVRKSIARRTAVELRDD